jgi:hypothetical protein
MGIRNETARIGPLHVPTEARRRVEGVCALVRAVLKEYRYGRRKRFRVDSELHEEVGGDGRRK